MTVDKAALYARVRTSLAALLSGETDATANLANTAALIYDQLPDINWAGFYLLRENELVLGPFQGKPACVRIPLGKGVCGAAVVRRSSLVVPNVHRFPEHIACDSASRSEIVIPLSGPNHFLGVLDIDSPVENRFDELDRAGLETLCSLLVHHLAPDGSPLSDVLCRI